MGRFGRGSASMVKRLAEEREHRQTGHINRTRQRRLESFDTFCERQSKRLEQSLSASVKKIENARDAKHPKRMALVQTIRTPGRHEQFISDECPYGLTSESLRIVTSD
jgi:hypothetical protein